MNQCPLFVSGDDWEQSEQAIVVDTLFLRKGPELIRSFRIIYSLLKYRFGLICDSFPLYILDGRIFKILIF